MKAKYTKEEMKRKVAHLSQQFKSHEDFLKKDPYPTYHDISKRQGLMDLFSSMHELMESSVFIETLLDEGYTLDGYNWKFRSPIMPLLTAYTAVGRRMINNENWNDNHQYQYGSFTNPDFDTSIFYCHQGRFIKTKMGRNEELSQVLKDNSPKNEAFLGTIEVDERAPRDKATLEQLMMDFDKHDKATAIVYIYNGIKTEPVFFIKENGKISAIGSSSLQTHDTIADLLKRKKIPLERNNNVFVDHTGDCSVYSELNINAVLHKARAQDNSVFSVLKELQTRKNDPNYSLLNSMVKPGDLTQANQSGLKPDQTTMARMFGNLSRACMSVGSSGWGEFCQESQVHHQFGFKSSHNPDLNSYYQTCHETKQRLMDRGLSGEPPSLRSYEEKKGEPLPTKAETQFKRQEEKKAQPASVKAEAPLKRQEEKKAEPLPAKSEIPFKERHRALFNPPASMESKKSDMANVKVDTSGIQEKIDIIERMVGAEKYKPSEDEKRRYGLDLGEKDLATVQERLKSWIKAERKDPETNSAPEFKMR